MENQEVTQSKKCLVTGATGVVGVPLVRELLESGYQVRILARNNSIVEPTLFSENVEIVRGDLKDFATLEKAVAAVDWVFHFAAKLHINNPSRALRQEYEETNFRATQNLVKLAKQAAVKKFILASTINVYGAGDKKRVFDETSPINPQGIYAETKAAAEQTVLSEDFGVVLRLAAVYGSRMKGNYVRLLRAIERGSFFFIGDGQNRRTLIHQQDAARATVLAAQKASAKTVYNATDGSFYSFNQIVEAMAVALDKKTPALRAPLTPFKLSVEAAELIAHALNLKLPLNRQLLEKVLEDVAVSGTKIKQELGFKPHYNLIQGWREVATSARRNSSSPPNGLSSFQ